LAKRDLSINLEMIVTSLARGFVLAFCAGLVLAVMGPFGTFERLDLPHRLGFWLSAICFGYLFNMPLYWVVRLAGEPRGLPIWLIILISASIAALPTTILVNGIAATLLSVSVIDRFADLYPLVLAVGVPLQALGHFASAVAIERQRAQKAQADNSATAAQEAADATMPVTFKPVQAAEGAQRFYQRLPKRLGADIECLQMEDHYLRVFTPLGSDLILMRMSDAAMELEGLDGLLVHRSFWVARAAVTGWTRDGKSLVLHLGNGKNVPVARDRQARLKAAGWLKPELQRA
jgi:LytTr DNA-binding domain